MDILGFIISKYDKKITVEVSPEKFVFSRGGNSISLDTYLYLYQSSGGDYIILTISEHTEKAHSLRVDLFGPDSVLPDKVTRSGCLEAFLHFGFVKLLNQKAMLRPTVIFRGADSLNNLTRGHQRKMLADAAKNAGAYATEFFD